MAKVMGLKMTGWILVILGVLAVYAPHIGFLANLVPTLDVISHSVFEIIAASLILIGAVLIAMRNKKRR